MKTIKTTKTVEVTCTAYEASDGSVFDNAEDCEQHENELAESIANAKTLPVFECFVPFSNWSYDVDGSQIFIVKCKKDYDALRHYKGGDYREEYVFFEEPAAYPAAILVIANDVECNGYVVDDDCIERMQHATNLMKQIVALTKIR